MSKAHNVNRRKRLHTEQGGVCYYCLCNIGHEIDGLGHPHLDHYMPRCNGGRRVVLSCGFCGHTKGMMPGPQFEMIVKKHFDTAPSKTIARMGIVAECKPINSKLQQSHEPNIVGKKKCAERAAAYIAAHKVSIRDVEKITDWATKKFSNKVAAAVIDAANRLSGTEKPHTGDRHWESWTGRHPVKEGACAPTAAGV